jgi:hypothetical protein
METNVYRHKSGNMGNGSMYIKVLYALGQCHLRSTHILKDTRKCKCYLQMGLYTYRSARGYCMQITLYWQHCSEVKVCTVERRSYKKKNILHIRNALDFHAELHEALDDCILPYWTSARWVQAFRSREVSSADMHCSTHCVCVSTEAWQWP